MHLVPFFTFSNTCGRRFVLFIIMLLLPLCAACQAKTGSSPIEWHFQTESIHIAYNAAADLNRYGGSAHTLMLLVFQLSDASDFRNTVRTTDGIQRLLQFQDTDQRETINLKDKEDLQVFFINPGSKETLTIDRVADGKWVGLVAGYFDLVPEQCSTLVRIPVKRTEEGIFWKKTSSRPDVLHLDLQLGPNAMYDKKDPS